VFELHLSSERITLSIADSSIHSFLDAAITAELTSVTPIVAASSPDNNASGNSRDEPEHQKALPPGGDTDPDIFEAHLQAQTTPSLFVADSSLLSPFHAAIATELRSVTPIAAASKLDSSTSGDSHDSPARQELSLPGDDSGAKTDPDIFKAYSQAQITPALSSNLSNDLTSLLKALNSGDTSAAKAGFSKVQVDSWTQGVSVVGDPTGNPLNTLISRLSDSLNPRTVQDAPQNDAQHDLAGFLVENGRGTGSLI
jgi:hypothetical protein